MLRQDFDAKLLLVVHSHHHVLKRLVLHYQKLSTSAKVNVYVFFSEWMFSMSSRCSICLCYMKPQKPAEFFDGPAFGGDLLDRCSSKGSHK